MGELAYQTDGRRSEIGGSSRKAVTQQKILGASMLLFATRGYHRTSTAQIAARAGVSRASIFWHFSDKATLFGETCRHFLVPFRESLEGSGGDSDPRQRILDKVAVYESFVREQRETIRAFVSWIFASQPHADFLRLELLAINGAFRGGLERDLAEILQRPVEAAHLAGMIVAMLHGDMLLSLGGTPRDRHPQRRAPVHLLLDRLLPERAQP
jgi:AcrR family transcriptional regulator